MMIAPKKTLAAASIGILAVCGPAAAADVDIDAVYEQLSPFMHHTCGSIVETFGDNEDQIAEIVRGMVILSLYNREIDILAVVEDESDREALGAEFVEELEEACDDDPGMLLAGAVDIAVKETVDAFD